MQPREMLLGDVYNLLLKNGFATSNPKDLMHAGFDIVARKDKLILIIKIVANAGSISASGVAGMTALSRAVDGASLILSPKSGSEPMEDGVVYTRGGVPLMSPNTFYDLIFEGVPPLVYAASGGYYVNINSKAIKLARERGMSLGDLAEMGGVSRRTIRMYEDGMGAKLEVAIRLEEKMGIPLIVPVDPLEPLSEMDEHIEENVAVGLVRDVFNKLHQMGYSVKQTDRCPFDAVTLDKNTILFTGIENKDSNLPARARAISNLSKVLEKHSVIFVDKRGRRVNMSGTPIIGCKELNNAQDKKKFMEMVEERL